MYYILLPSNTLCSTGRVCTAELPPANRIAVSHLPTNRGTSHPILIRGHFPSLQHQLSSGGKHESLTLLSMATLVTPFRGTCLRVKPSHTYTRRVPRMHVKAELTLYTNPRSRGKIVEWYVTVICIHLKASVGFD
jgi:hypothetical protein